MNSFYIIYLLLFQRENNQKLGILESLLEIGAWDNAKAIFDRLPENFAVVHKSVSRALCTLIHTVIDPVYDKWVNSFFLFDMNDKTNNLWIINEKTFKIIDTFHSVKKCILGRKK